MEQFSLKSLKRELEADPEKLGYLPLEGEVEVLELAHPAAVGVHPGRPAKATVIGKLVGNDVKNAAIINAKPDGGKSRAQVLWGDDAQPVTAQQVADTHWREGSL